MKKIVIITASLLPMGLYSIGAAALYAYAVEDAKDANDIASAKLAASIFQNIDFKGNMTAINKNKKAFQDKFKKDVEYFAPAQGGIPSNLKASSDKIDDLIKSANTPEGYLKAFKTIVTETGKPAIDGLKAKGVSASDINGVIAQLKA